MLMKKLPLTGKNHNKYPGDVFKPVLFKKKERKKNHKPDIKLGNTCITKDNE